MLEPKSLKLSLNSVTASITVGLICAEVISSKISR
uniref:Bm14473 n=1 Tax=Brugia malayi TaxID=6279 RepID=A0A1I9G3H9_BRUMA|nr:Bm14473 [Brugia malayi]